MRSKFLSSIQGTIAVLSVVIMAFFLGSAAVSSAAPPTATPAQQAEAIAEPSVVFIQTQWVGYVVSAPIESADALDVLSPGGSAPKYTVTTTCSGYIANPDGHIVTAGHCVDNQSVQYGGKGLIISSAVAELASRLNLSPGEAAAMLKYAYSNWKVEGSDSGSPPDRVVGVYPVKAASGITVSNPMQANVVDFKPFTQGDVALLKVQSDTPMPALTVAPSEPAQGTDIVASGYPGSVLRAVDLTNEPSMKEGSVSGSKTVAGVPFTEIDAPTSPGMSGGPVVDMEGRVVGTVSWTPGEETQNFNFITATSAVQQILASNSVSTALSTTDQTYRAGLNDYFNGKYHAAAKKFAQVLAVEPDHAGAQQYQRLAITNYANEKSASSNTLMWVLIGVGAAVVVLAIAALLIIRKRRAGRAGVSAGAPVPTAGGPGMMSAPPAPPVAPVVPPPKAAAQVAPTLSLPPTAETRLTSERPAPIEPPAPTEAAPVAATGGYCPYCGTPHAPDAHFCAECGFHFPLKAPHGDGR